MAIESGTQVRVPGSDTPDRVVQVGYVEDGDGFPVKLCEPVSFGGSLIEALRFVDVEQGCAP